MKKIFTDLRTFPPSFVPKIVEHNSAFRYSESIADCDYVLLPYWEVIFDYTDKHYLRHHLDPAIRTSVTQSAKDLIDAAEVHKKKLLVFQVSDSDKEIPVTNAVFFRTSLYKSRQRENEFALPGSDSDLLKEFKQNKLEIRKKQARPNVGFIGSSKPLNITLLDLYRSSLNLANQFLGKFDLSVMPRHQWSAGQILRKKALQELLKNKSINTDFSVVIRGYLNQTSAKKRELNKNRFVNNIFNNDYILCARGAGNYSFRFYETLSSGRIPLFVNTDCVLPFDSIIDWKKYCVWVEESDINKIDQILLDFHNDLSNDDFEYLQFKIRKLWEDMICSSAFFNNFDKCLNQAERK